MAAERTIGTRQYGGRAEGEREKKGKRVGKRTADNLVPLGRLVRRDMEARKANKKRRRSANFKRRKRRRATHMCVTAPPTAASIFATVSPNCAGLSALLVSSATILSLKGLTKLERSSWSRYPNERVAE